VVLGSLEAAFLAITKREQQEGDPPAQGIEIGPYRKAICAGKHICVAAHPEPRILAFKRELHAPSGAARRPVPVLFMWRISTLRSALIGWFIFTRAFQHREPLHLHFLTRPSAPASPALRVAGGVAALPLQSGGPGLQCKRAQQAANTHAM
jgi:hypothetical protein